MTVFTIDEQNNITAFASHAEAAAASTTPFDSFSNQRELAELLAGGAAARLTATWNSLPGVTPVQRFQSRQVAAARIWKRIQSLAETQPDGSAGSAQKPKPPKPAGKGRKAAPPPEPRKGTKTARVLAMLQRKNGATLSEIMQKMGWQQHTVRGFMAGALKKAGYRVLSFKSEGGERTYRLNP
jgi:hypothetical protein